MSRFLSKTKEKLKPYTPGEQPQGVKLIKLNTNESPFPPSPKVKEALLRANEIEDLRLYSDPEETALKKAIAARYGVRESQVLAGNGSDEILAFAFQAFGDGQSPLQFADLTYGFYPVLCELYGIPAKVVPLEEDFSLDVEKYKNCGCSCVIANPNAPTGMALPVLAIREILETNPDHVVMVDEAYVDFGGESAVPLVKEFENLVVIQTFSKSRCLAGGRIGFAIAQEELIGDLNRIKYSFNPYNVNRLSILAGAAAVEDEEYLRQCASRIAAARDWTAGELRRMGFTVLPSKTNFLFAKSGRLTGTAYFKGLRERGILVRRWDTDRIRDYVRISIGSEEDMKTFIRVTEELELAAPE